MTKIRQPWMKEIVQRHLDVDYDCNTLSNPSLKYICAKALISNILWVKKYCMNLPTNLHIFLLNVAIDQKRILCQKELLKIYPSEDFEFSIPPILRNFRIFETDSTKPILDEDKLSDISKNILVILSMFLPFTEGKYVSHLRNIDFKDFPLDKECVKLLLCCLLKQMNNKAYFKKPNCKKQTAGSTRKIYTIKVGCVISNAHEQMMLLDILKKLWGKGADINLLITGLFFQSIYEPVSEILNFLDEKEFQRFSFNYSTPICADLLFFQLKRFTNLKTLDFTYSGIDFLKDGLIKAFSKMLQQLHHLTRLSLAHCKTTNCIKDLLGNACKKQQPDLKKLKTTNSNFANCCFEHRRTLLYLNLSGCRLDYQDFNYLAKTPLTNCLKHLVLNDLSIDINSLIEICKAVNSNVVVFEAMGGYKLADDDSRLNLFRIINQSSFKLVELVGFKSSSI